MFPKDFESIESIKKSKKNKYRVCRMGMNDKEDEHWEPSTTTVSQSRLQFFQSTKKPVKCRRHHITPWGKVTVDGCLGQGHANLLESLCYSPEKVRSTQNGAVELLIDMYKIRRLMGSGTKPYSYSTVMKFFKDIMASVLTTETDGTGSDLTISHIIQKITRTKRLLHNPLNPDELRTLWTVTFSEEYSMFIRNDLSLKYNPKSVIVIKSGVGQAVLRHLLTHKNEPNGGWILDNIFTLVGAVNKARIRGWRSEIRENSEFFLKAGYEVFDGSDKKLRIRKTSKTSKN